jgi:hypothetical protein
LNALGQPPRHVRTSSRVLGVYRIVVSDFLDPTRLEIGLRSSSGILAMFTATYGSLVNLIRPERKGGDVGIHQQPCSEALTLGV